MLLNLRGHAECQIYRMLPPPSKASWIFKQDDTLYDFLVAHVQFRETLKKSIHLA